MDYIRKLPLLMGTGAGLVIGLIGLSAGVPNKDNMLNMCIGMVVFCIVGILARSTIMSISEYIAEITRKREEEERQRKKEQDRQESEKEKEETVAQSIDLRIGDESGLEDDGFEDLRIAEFIKNEMK